MNEIPLLRDIVTIFGLSIAVLLVCARLHVPAVVGLLLTGVISGPHGFQLVRGLEEVEVLAGIGVVLLLFTIGLEFSLTQLLRIKKQVFLGGFAQVIFTVAAVALLTHHLFGAAWGAAIFNGFLVSASSTAIVLRVLQDKGQVSTPHGQLALAILIFQDVAVVPMMLVTPFLAGSDQVQTVDLLVHLGKGILISSGGFVGRRRRWFHGYCFKLRAHATASCSCFLCCFFCFFCGLADCECRSVLGFRCISCGFDYR